MEFEKGYLGRRSEVSNTKAKIALPGPRCSTENKEPPRGQGVLLSKSEIEALLLVALRDLGWEQVLFLIQGGVAWPMRSLTWL